MNAAAEVVPKLETRRLAGDDPIAVRCELVQRWLLLGGAFCLPLIVVWDGIDKFVLPKLLAARLLVIALALVYLARGLLVGRFTCRRSSLDIPLLAFVTSTLLSSLVAVNHNVAVFGVYLRYEGLLTILTYAALFWLTVQTIATREDARHLGWAVLASAIVVSLVAIVQSFVLPPGRETPVGTFQRAYSTMGNWVELGIFLAMVIPVAIHFALDLPSRRQRLLASATILPLGLGLLASLTRAAWVGALVGVLIFLMLHRSRARFAIAAAAVLVALAVILAAGFATGRLGGRSALAQAVTTRVQSATSLKEGSGAERLHVWSDSLRLLSLHPLLGSGPDSFGLVYPSVQNKNTTPGFDKAHNELLQIAVTNGVVGLLAFYLVLMSIARQLWRNRHDGFTTAVVSGLIAYELALQTEFSWVPTALPFWLLAGVAFSAARQPVTFVSWPRRAGARQQAALFLGSLAGAVMLAFVAVAQPLIAERLFYRAVSSLDVNARATARSEVAEARRWNPTEAVYAVEAGNLALDLRFGFRPGSLADPEAAREAYRDGIRLGSTDPAAFRGLAVADLVLGDRHEALAAALRAVELNRLDPDSRALLQLVENST